MKILDWINHNLRVIAFGAFFILALVLTWSLNRNSKLSNRIAQYEQTQTLLDQNLKISQDSMQFYKDKYGNSLSEIKLLSATSEMLENQYSGIYKRYTDLLGKTAKNQELIAFLETQIRFKDQIIADLQANAGNGSYIINDSTIAIDEGKTYDSSNFYSVKGKVVARILDNKIKAGTIDLTTLVGLGIEFGISRDKKTRIASITSKTAFPAKVSMSGITQIEKEINKKPSSYLGLGFFGGYGATLEKSPQLGPIIGIGLTYTPRWLTVKIRNR